MASLLLTSASKIGYLEHPSVHHKECLVVGVFGKTWTPYNDLVYKVGLLDKGKFSIDWGKDIEYTKGHYPSVALIHTHIEGEAEQKYYVVETHQSQVYKDCYYRIGEVNKDRTIEFGPDIKLCRGVNPKVCAQDDGTVIIISEMPYSYGNILQYSIGQVNVTAKTVEWHEKCKELEQLSGFCPSVSMSKDNVVVACVCSSELKFIVGNLKRGGQEIAWGAAVNREVPSVGTNPSISVNSHGHVVEVHESGYARRLFYSIGECRGEKRKIVWNNDFCDREYTLGRSPSISLADDGYVIENHLTNCGYQTYLSHGQLKIRSVNVCDGQVDATDKLGGQ